MPHSTNESAQAEQHWWHKAAIYQIYPASFNDSNGDGFGDIQGIIDKVDYISELGVDAVWLSPCYKSPYVDMGYDIADYREIDQRFGTVGDIERLIAKLKSRNLELLMDLVVNHTSDQHSWFQESRSSVNSTKRGWYIWRKGRTITTPDGTVKRMPPNNWESLFKGSAWEYDELTDEYYLRIFAKEQPDLNWDNVEVRQAVYEDMRFWLDKGIAGFRMDVINMISKPDGLPDAPITVPSSYTQPAASLYCNGPRVHEYLQELRKEVLDQYQDLMTVGEVPFTSEPAQVREYIEPERKELGMLFQFDLFDIDTGPGGKFTPSGWQLRDFKTTIAKWQKSLSFSSGAWQTVFLESHDAARSVSRFGDGSVENRFKVAKMLAMLETTLSGTLFIHQGQEIGMANLADDIPIEDYQDIETRGFLSELQKLRQAAEPHRVIELSEIVDDVADEVRLKARDHGRMPIPWDASRSYAGFSDTTAQPWTRLNTDSNICNVAKQEKTEDSVLNCWRKMLAFRKQYSDTLVFGDFDSTTLDNSPVFAYHRTPLPDSDAVRMMIVLNLSNAEDVEYVMPAACDHEPARYKAVERTTRGVSQKTSFESGDKIKLSAYEGLVLAY